MLEGELLPLLRLRYRFDYRVVTAKIDFAL
jgi:hypothetical protein